MAEFNDCSIFWSYLRHLSKTI